MGRSAKQVYRLTGRGAMYSPGAPSLGHEIERRFWQRIATGITSEKAAEAVGVSQAVGLRRFRDPKRTQVFLSSFGPIRQHFALKRHLLRASLYRKQLAQRFDAWHRFTELTQNPSAVCANTRLL